jgi:putative spermidine/putrescine transport system permease protein
MSKEQILSSDGIPLELSLKKAERKNKLKALFLVGPLLLFILITFVFLLAICFLEVWMIE